MKIRLTTLLLLLIAGANLQAQSPRVVLIEDFSSVTCVNCPAASIVVNKVAEEKPQEVVTIQYHLDIPGQNDPFYAMNKPHNNARRTYYDDFQALPQVFIGGYYVDGKNEANVRSELNTQLAESSPITLTATQSRSGNTVNVTVTAQSTEALTSGYRIYAAAVEHTVKRPATYFTQQLSPKPIPYNNETEFHDLFRTFASPATGDALSVAANQKKTFNYSYTVGSDWNADDMYVVVWVQDEFNLEVLQAGFSARPTNSVKVEEIAEGMGSISMTPNPTRGQSLLNVRVENAERFELTIYNARGEVVRSEELGVIEAGSSTVPVSVANLPAGVYRAVLRSSSINLTSPFTVVH